MYSGKEAQGQSEIPEGHCIKEVKLFHLITTAMIQNRCFFILISKKIHKIISKIN